MKQMTLWLTPLFFTSHKEKKTNKLKAKKKEIYLDKFSVLLLSILQYLTTTVFKNLYLTLWWFLMSTNCLIILNNLCRVHFLQVWMTILVSLPLSLPDFCSPIWIFFHSFSSLPFRLINLWFHFCFDFFVPISIHPFYTFFTFFFPSSVFILSNMS